MSEPIDMDLRRKKRAEIERELREVSCEYCGAPPHDQPLACPRVASVTYYNDGNGEVASVKVELRELPG